MAIDLSKYTPAPYQGRLLAKPVGLCLASKGRPQTVVLTIDWSLYPGHVVSINLQAGAGQQVVDPLDFIRSMYVDNQGVRSAVAVMFTDTAFEVFCEPDAAIAAPVITFQKTLVVLGGFSANAGTTRIYLNNFPLAPFESKPIGEVLAAAYSSTLPGQGAAIVGYGAGDSTKEIISVCTVLTNVIVLPAVVTTTGFYIINNLDFSVVGNYSDSLTPIAMQYQLKQGALPALYQWSWYARNDIEDFSRKQIACYQPTQTRQAQATAIELVNLTGVAMAGAVILTINYTAVDDTV